MLVGTLDFIFYVLCYYVKNVYIRCTGVTVDIFLITVMYHYAIFVGFQAIEHAMIRRKQSSVLTILHK